MKIVNLNKLKDIPSCIKYYEEVKKILQSSRKELEERTIKALNHTIEHARRNSPFYIERFRKVHLSQKIKSLAELTEFPFTTKADSRSAYPFGFLAVPKSRIVRYGESTGTTGSPTSSFVTRDDWDRGNIWATLSYLNFFSSEDMIFNAVPYELAFSALDADKAFWNIGATVVGVGTLNMICPWERVIKMMSMLHPSVLICTPTRAMRLYDMFLDEEYSPEAVGLKTLFYIGETCSASKLKKIAKLWNVNLVTAYGTTETNSLSLPCQHGNQHLTENRFYFEVIDPAKEIPVKNGERGELVITSLASEAMPLVRYRTGDIVSLHSKACSCGIPFRTIQHYGRYDERIAIKDKVILKVDLEEAILKVKNTGCYYSFSIEDDKLNIMVEIVGDNKKEIIAAICKNVSQQFEISVSVQEINKALICKAMDRMLKPGSVSLTHIKAVTHS